MCPYLLVSLQESITYTVTTKRMDNTASKANVICVVVTYNRLALLKETIGAVLGQTCQPRHTIVIDNHSTDGTADYLASLAGDARIETVRMDRNTGGAGGFSEGIRRAALMRPDWIWVMDDDTVPSPDAVERMVPFMAVDGVGFLSSKVVWTDGSLHRMNLPGYMSDEAQRKAVMARLGLAPDCGAEPVAGASFVSLFIKGSLPWKIGLPYKEFFIWSDDAEYTERIVNSGYAGLLVDGSVALHKTAANYEASLDTVPAATAWKLYYGERNQSFMRRMRKGRVAFWLSQLNTLRLHAHKIRKRHLPKDEERALLAASRKGLLAGFTFCPKVERVE